MSRRILKTAVVGLGRIAWSDHLPTILKNPDFEAITTVDPLHERGKEAAAEFGITHTYESVTAMLEQETPDLAVVCSPTMFHAEQTILLLNHGVHVFCDKPAASNSGEVRAMFAAAARNNRKLMIYQPRRMFPDSFAVKEILRSGKLGNVYQMKLFAGAYVRRNDWQAYLKNGGGMLRNYGVHYMDQAMYLAGESLEALACRTGKDRVPRRRRRCSEDSAAGNEKQSAGGHRHQSGGRAESLSLADLRFPWRGNACFPELPLASAPLRSGGTASDHARFPACRAQQEISP